MSISIIIVAVAVVVAVVGLYFWFQAGQGRQPSPPAAVEATAPINIVPTEPESTTTAKLEPIATPEPAPTMLNGMKLEILQAGTGVEAKNGDTVTVDYVGTLTTGQKFDASRDHGQPFSFPLGAGQVIKGWDQGVVGMKVGEKRRLTIPPALGYGANGAGPIPPNSTLIFEIELLKLN